MIKFMFRRKHIGDETNATYSEGNASGCTAQGPEENTFVISALTADSCNYCHALCINKVQQRAARFRLM
jgi:hypothetical protein